MAVKAPLILCCATKWESEPLVRRWGLSQASPLRFEGSVRGVDVVLIKTGIGSSNVNEALGSLSLSPAYIVSTGFAGALQPKMASGDLVLDVRGLDLEVPQAAREIAAAQGTAIHFGKIAHSDKVLSRPQEKRELGAAQRCSAVDMESQAIRAWAESRNVPFLTARVILDTVEDSLPSEIPAGERLTDLATFAIRNLPELPTLLRIARLQKRSISRLEAFLEELLPRL